MKIFFLGEYVDYQWQVDGFHLKNLSDSVHTHATSAFKGQQNLLFSYGRRKSCRQIAVSLLSLSHYSVFEDKFIFLY